MNLYAIARGIEGALGGKRAHRSRMIVHHVNLAARRLSKAKGDDGQIDAALLVVGLLCGANSVREGGKKAHTYASMVGYTLDELADAKAAYQREPHHLTFHQFIGRALREPDGIAAIVDRIEVDLDEPRATVFLALPDDPEHAVLVFMPVGREREGYDDGIELKAVLRGAKLVALGRHLADQWTQRAGSPAGHG